MGSKTTTPSAVILGGLFHRDRDTRRLPGKGVSRTNALEALVLSGFVRGLSVRDVEATLAEALGPEATLSKSTVSRVCEAIKTEFHAWKARDLSGMELEYPFLDGSHFRMHPGARAEPVLCAWGITTQGSPVLVGLAPGAHEGHDPGASFLGELTDRGLRPPLLVSTDGAPGLVGPVEVVFSQSLRQRCLVHRAVYTTPPEETMVICADELGPVIPAASHPPPAGPPTATASRPLDYGRGPEKTWVYGALRIVTGRRSA